MSTQGFEKRDFKGVWIPKKLYFNSDLTWTEKMLLTEIDSLDGGDGCFASNAYLAEFLQVSRDWLKHLLSALKERGLIAVTERDGRRYIKLVSDANTFNRDTRCNGYSETEDDGDTEVPPGVELSLSAAQEDDVLTVYDFWNSYKGQGNGRWHTHTKISYSIRMAVSQTLIKHTVEQVCEAIVNYASILQSDDYYWDYEWTLQGFLTSERSIGDKKWYDFLPENFDRTAYAGQKRERKLKSTEIVIPDDKNPEITRRLIKMYRNTTNSQRFEPSPKQTVQFIDAASKFVDFYRVYSVPNEDQFKILRQSLESAYIEKGEILCVGNLNSDYTWTILMPQRMRELGYIE